MNSFDAHDDGPARRRPRALWFGVVLVVGSLSGCGDESPPRGELSGKITVGGKPVEEGSVMLEPLEGTQGPAAGSVIKDGVYRVDEKKGPFPGRYRVLVHGFRRTGRMIKLPPDGYNPQGSEVPEQVPMVPRSYQTNSPLTVEIKQGKNVFDIQIPAPESMPGGKPSDKAVSR